jgi:hypothetical protein
VEKVQARGSDFVVKLKVEERGTADAIDRIGLVESVL